MRVIVRAYGGEPLERVVVAQERHVVFVVNPSRLEDVGNTNPGGIGFPWQDTFEFDPQQLGALAAAWESGDRQRIEACWRGARPVTPASLHLEGAAAA